MFLPRTDFLSTRIEEGARNWEARVLNIYILYSFLVCSFEDTSAQLETVEGLQELASKPPYNVDCSWSGEAKSLREIAVTEPNKLTDAFILKFFKSLRIVDKKVCNFCCVNCTVGQDLVSVWGPLS